MPVCFGIINVNDQDMRFLDKFTGRRFCQCSIEILYQPSPGVEEQLYREEQPCYITEFPDDDSANAIGIQLKSPFYVHANTLAHAAQYQVRFHFGVRNQEKWLPLSLHQLSGLDPSHWQHTADCSHGLNPSLWAIGYYPLASISAGQDSATTLYRIRIEYEYGQTQELRPVQKRQFTVWDLIVRCWRTERVPSDAPSHQTMNGTPNLRAPEISSTPMPSGTAVANLAVPIIKVPKPSSRPRLKARYSPRGRAYNATTTRRRSKRLENKREVVKRVRQSCN